MKNQKQEKMVDEKQKGRLPYKTPKLERLGNVRQVTEGVFIDFYPDSGVYSA
ncbi:MAG: hypothetical protein AB1414_20170 [bacterium]